MDSASLMSIRVIPKSVKEETGHHALERLHHTPYRDEVRLFSCLQRGDLKKLIYELGQIGIQNITVGQMSENDLQQQKYMAVSFITLATRYAIQGGLGESNAYAYSDDFIRRIDAASTKRTVHAAIVDGAIELTNMVSRAQKDLTYSPHVRRCIAYINKNPDRKLTVAAVAAHCGLSYIEKFKAGGWRYPFMIFTLTDETYSVNASILSVPDGVDEPRARFLIGEFDHVYWIIGSVLGSLLSAALPMDFTGIDFSMTALFVVIFIDLIRNQKGRAGLIGALGLCAGILCLLIFGADKFLLPSLVLTVAVLSAGRPFFDPERRAAK